MSGRPKCAVCNAPKGNTPPHPIYLNFAISALEKMAEVTEGLSRIDENAPAASVKKASEKIKGVLPAVRSTDVEARLLDAAEKLEQSVYPIFARLEEVSKEVNTLKAKIATLERRNQALEIERESMKEANTHLRVKAATRDHTKLVHREADYERLAKRQKQGEEELSVKEAELIVLRQRLEEYEKRNHLLNNKLKALGRQTRKDQERRHSSVDDSLVIVDVPRTAEPVVRARHQGAGPSQPVLRGILKRPKPLS
ncbi:hypothetical protein ONZ45_g9525 [Pleurotus djamor]|nr:hypothetical protein ONZ45_g9525 [Pleurotus djamor]